jgi:Xaa-Pro dipeptidase
MNCLSIAFVLPNYRPMLLNQTRAMQFMRQHGLDVIVATSPVNVTYFSDYFCWSDALFKEYMGAPGASSSPALICAVLPLEGPPALVLGPAFALNACDSWVRDLRFYGDFPLEWSAAGLPSNDTDRRFVTLLRDQPRYPTAMDALFAVLRERGLDGASIGLDSECLSAANLDLIRNGLPRASIKNCSNLIRLIRMVKSPEELKRLTRAATINEQAGFETFRQARPGVSSIDLAQHYRTFVAKSGADVDHFSYSDRGLSISTESECRFMENDVLYMDFGCVCDRYFSDTAATLAVNGISPLLLEKYNALRLCVDEGVTMMRPKVKASQIQAAMMKALKECGISASFPHGHGIGMEIRDYPIIVPDNGLRIQDDCLNVSSDLPMEEGMVNNLEVCVFLPMIGAVALEESLVVGANGARRLIPHDRRAPFVTESGG